MSHVSPSHAAAVSHHAVRRYAERVLGATVPAGLADWQALAHVRAQGWDCDAIRARFAGVGGLVVAAGMRAGVVVVPEERMRVRVDGGVVVTVVTPEPRERGRGGLRRAA